MIFAYDTLLLFLSLISTFHNFGDQKYIYDILEDDVSYKILTYIDTILLNHLFFYYTTHIFFDQLALAIMSIFPFFHLVILVQELTFCVICFSNT